MKPASKKFEMSEIDSLLNDMTVTLASDAAARTKKDAEARATRSLMQQFNEKAGILEVGFSDKGQLVGVRLLNRKSMKEKTFDIVWDKGVPQFAVSGNTPLDTHLLSFSNSQQKAILLELAKIR